MLSFMDRGPWLAAVHAVAKSRTQLSNFTFFLSRQYFGSNFFPCLKDINLHILPALPSELSDLHIQQSLRHFHLMSHGSPQFDIPKWNPSSSFKTFCSRAPFPGEWHWWPHCPQEGAQVASQTPPFLHYPRQPAMSCPCLLLLLRESSLLFPSHSSIHIFLTSCLFPLTWVSCHPAGPSMQNKSSSEVRSQCPPRPC